MKTTKFKVITSTFLTSALLLGACGNNNDEVEENELNETEVQKQQEETAKEDTTVETPEEPKEVAFQSFNLHIDTADAKDAVVAQYTAEPKDSLYTNEKDSANIEGEEANELLKSVLGELQLNKDMADEDVIQRVTLAFGVEEYTNLKLEIAYDDEKEVKTYTDNKNKK